MVLKDIPAASSGKNQGFVFFVPGRLSPDSIFPLFAVFRFFSMSVFFSALRLLLPFSNDVDLCRPILLTTYKRLLPESQNFFLFSRSPSLPLP